VLENKIELKNIIDLSVYSKNKNLRLPNQSKLLKEYEKEKITLKQQINKAKEKNEKNDDLEKQKKKLEKKILKNESVLKITSQHNFKDTLLINHFHDDPNILDCSFLNTKTEEITQLNKEYKYENIVYINNDKSNLNKVLPLIPKIYFENYDDWYKIGTAIKNINCECYDLFDFYSRGPPNYNEEENKIYFKSFKGNNSWGYLFGLIDDTKINKIIKKQLIEDYKKYDAIENTNNFKIINDESKYINSVNLIESTEKHVILFAHPGKGKTYAIQEFINNIKMNTNKNVNLELEQINIKIQNKIKYIDLFLENYAIYIKDDERCAHDYKKHEL
jgi:hypothetical protein